MARRGISLAEINPRFLPQIEAQLRRQAITPEGHASVAEKDRVKQKGRKTSLLEQRWGIRLGSSHPHSKIYPQFPLAIGTGCNYYLDFLVVTGDRSSGNLTFVGWEVKGRHAWTAAIVKLKAAARYYPWIQFWMVSESKVTKGAWVKQEVMP